MGKLTNMVAAESSIGNRVKYNARRIRFAGIGLFDKIEQERVRLYQQILEKGNTVEGNNDDQSLVAVFNAFSSGVVIMAREESQRVFDDLVAAGETKTNQIKSAVSAKKASGVELKVVETEPSGTSAAKPVKKAAKKPAAKKATAKKSTAKKSTAKKPAVKKAPRKNNEELMEEEILLAFGDAQELVKTLAGTADEADQLELYALYEQGEFGDVKGRRPAMSKELERVKYDARRELKGMSKAEAIEKYVAKVEELTV